MVIWRVSWRVTHLALARTLLHLNDIIIVIFCDGCCVADDIPGLSLAIVMQFMVILIVAMVPLMCDEAQDFLCWVSNMNII